MLRYRFSPDKENFDEKLTSNGIMTFILFERILFSNS